MGIDLTLAEQELLAETFRRAQSRMTARERGVELLLIAGLIAAVAWLWWFCPPGQFAPAPAVLCMLVMALATRVRFDTPLGFTVATQLAFVPLLFTIPVAIVPIAVVITLALARLPELQRDRIQIRPLGLVIGNSWFSIGPAAVFAIAGTAPQHAAPVLLLAALASQFAVDFAVSAIRFGTGTGASLSSQLREMWVYAIDAALSPIGLLVAKELHHMPSAALAEVPLLGLLSMFARERHDRLESLIELNDAYRGTALVLGDVVEADDGYTGEHSRGVVALALAVADRLSLSPGRRRNLEFAALLHDVGKIVIPKEIINKADKLDPHEWTIIKSHTIEGQKLLDRVGGFMREVGLIVRSHHERWDGGGYPDGLSGDAIPLEARIIACCDTWNAMRTDRSYRKALPFEVALAELLDVAGSQLDARVVAALATMVSCGEHRGASNPGLGTAAGSPWDLTEPVETGSQGALARERSQRPALAASATFAGRVAAALHSLSTAAVARHAVSDGALEDVRSGDPVERLLEDSWASRSQAASRRELAVEAVAGVLFLAAAVPLAASALNHTRLPLGLTALLVAVYIVVSRTIKFPLGAGSVVPSYLVLVPMLLLLPAGTVPLLCALALVAGAGLRLLAGRGSAQGMLFSLPDAWHTLGPAAVLSLAGPVEGFERAAVYIAALLAGFVVDLVVSTARESLALAIAPRLQGRVIAQVWLVDACFAPLGLFVALAARANAAGLMLVVPLLGLLLLVGRDRNARIAESQHRLGLLARERTRLQAAVHRLGDAFGAKLDLGALTDVLLSGSIDALDADAGRLFHDPVAGSSVLKTAGELELAALLQAAGDVARAARGVSQIEADGVWALAVVLQFGAPGAGALAVARRGRAFREDEQALMLGLVERAQSAAAEIVAHQALRDQALSDPLTGLGNRRKLAAELDQRLLDASLATPLLLMLFDLDGFKSYNDTFGHVAGDQLLARLGHKLASAVAPDGAAYRLGGDEFCVLMPADREQLQDGVAAAAGALEEQGEKFSITASCGTVLLPHEASAPDYALQLADKRMYARKHGRPSGAREQAHDVLIHIMRAKQPDLSDHANGVTELAVAVGRRLGLSGEQLDVLCRAASLHDVGKVGVPDAILAKPGPLDPQEWGFVRQHTILGERILSAAPALRPVATIVRASHERWDGSGYPDGLRTEQIPLAARIIAVCDAYHAITSDRCYRPAGTDQLARDELNHGSGQQFDPEVVAAFLAELDQPSAYGSSKLHSTNEPGQDLAATVVARVDQLLQGKAA